MGPDQDRQNNVPPLFSFFLPFFKRESCFALCVVSCALCTVHCALCTVRCALCVVHLFFVLVNTTSSLRLVISMAHMSRNNNNISSPLLCLKSPITKFKFKMSCSNEDGTRDGTPRTRTITTTTKSSHYQILGVSSNASLEEVKAAHRSLALRLHPDKQQLPKNTSTSTANEEEFNFRQVQLAWECLRDPLKRKEYDEDVQRQQTQRISRTQGATRLFLSEMQECIEDEEDEDEENALSTTAIHNHNTGYVYECRCGDYIEIWNDEDISTNMISKEILVDCPGCCLSYCIVLDK